MRKIFYFLLALSPMSLWAIDVANDWAVGNISVSSNTVTSIRAGTSNLSGRYMIRLQNTDPTYAVSIGSNSTFTYAAGWLIYNSSGTIDLPLNAGTTVYGLAAPNSTQLNVTIKVIELK